MLSVSMKALRPTKMEQLSVLRVDFEADCVDPLPIIGDLQKLRCLFV